MLETQIFTLCYYAAIMLLLNVYYAAINLLRYYAAIMLPLCQYYAAINFKSILCCYYAAIIRKQPFDLFYAIHKKNHMIGTIYQTIFFFHCGIPIVTTYCESTIYKWISIKCRLTVILLYLYIYTYYRYIFLFYFQKMFRVLNHL